MGATKSDQFPDEQVRTAQMAKALSHPARIAIIEHLLQSPSCICNDLVEILPLAQPTVSQHLKELKQAGWIKGSIEGHAICYCVDEKALLSFLGIMNQYAESIRNQNNSCCQ